MITKEEREKDKAICEAATKGTWEECGHSVFVAGEEPGESAAEWVVNVTYANWWPDRTALANAANRMPAYIADAEEMDRRISKIEQAEKNMWAHIAELRAVGDREGASYYHSRANALRWALGVLRGES